MYRGLYDAGEHVDGDDRIRVVILRGAGHRLFVAGTDISQLQEFTGAEDALAYERSVSRNVGRLESLRKPTIAMIRGLCVGGGAIIAMACDLRMAASDTKWGIPIARTLWQHLVGGESLSASSH